MLIDTLKTASITALKNKDTVARNILGMVINRYNLLTIEMKSKGVEPTDADLVQIIQKIARELVEEKEGYVKTNNLLKANEIDAQNAIISQYLPKMLSEEEVRKEISKLDDKTLPNVMKHFKINFNGKVDMKLVGEVARTL